MRELVVHSGENECNYRGNKMHMRVERFCVDLSVSKEIIL